MTANNIQETNTSITRDIKINNLMLPTASEKNERIIAKSHNHARHVILNKPKELNCIWTEMIDQLFPYLKAWEKSDDAKLITITGVDYKKKIFSAGGDLKSVGGALAQEDSAVIHNLLTDVGIFYEFLLFIATMSTPVVAIIDGITIGGGAGLVAQLPFKIATENTIYAMPEASIGLVTDCSSTFGLSRYDSNIGLYLGLTSNHLFAEDVVLCGLASHFVHSSNLENMKHKLWTLENPTLTHINEVINEFAVKPNHKPSKKCILYGHKLDVLENCFKYDTVEEIMESLLMEGSKFSLSCLEAMNKRSPTSLKVIHEAHKRGKNMTFNECLDMEFGLWQKLTKTHDLKIGTGAHITGNKNPDWSPKTLAEVDYETDILVDIFEAPRSHKLIFNPQKDFVCNPFPQYCLPSQLDIELLQVQYGLTEPEYIIAWFEANQYGKFGVRQKIKDYLERKNRNEKSVAKL